MLTSLPLLSSADNQTGLVQDFLRRDFHFIQSTFGQTPSYIRGLEDTLLDVKCGKYVTFREYMTFTTTQGLGYGLRSVCRSQTALGKKMQNLDLDLSHDFPIINSRLGSMHLSSLYI